MRKLRHHSLALTSDAHDVEVWADESGDTPHRSVTLYVQDGKYETQYVDLTLAEARALAALLVVAADQQERGL